MRLLDRINRTGTTVVMATHDQRIVDAMRRRVIELDHGIARARPGARRLRRRELTPRMWTRIAYFTRETLVSLRRNLLMTVAGIMTVAVSLVAVRRHPAAVEVGRPRHRAHEGRRRARDLHEGRGDASRRSTAVEARARRPTRDVEVRSSFLDQGGRVRGVQADLPRTSPTSSRTSTADDAARRRSGSRRPRPSSPTTVAAQLQTAARRRRGQHAGEAAQGPARRHQHGSGCIFIVISLRAARVVAVPDREHDPARDVRPAPRDRGDEARRRVELVRARPVHGRGPRAGLVGAGLAFVAVRRLKTSASTRRSTTANSFFSEFYVTTGDATLDRVRRARRRGRHRPDRRHASACAASSGPESRA